METVDKIKFISIILVIALIAISASLLLFKDKKGVYYTYNGFDVIKVQQDKYTGYVVYTYINNQGPYIINTRYDPKSLEDFEIENNLKSKIFKTNIYISYKDLDILTGKSIIAGKTIKDIIEEIYKIPVTTEENSKTCQDVSSNSSVIRFELGDENKVYSENDCIIMKGITEEDFIKGSNLLIYKTLGIME